MATKTIGSLIQDINTSKANIVQALINKGVGVPVDAKLADLANYINQLEMLKMYKKTISANDWTESGDTSAKYSYSIPASTHKCGTNPFFATYDNQNYQIFTGAKVSPQGDITLLVNEKSITSIVVKN